MKTSQRILIGVSTACLVGFGTAAIAGSYGYGTQGAKDQKQYGQAPAYGTGYAPMQRPYGPRYGMPTPYYRPYGGMMPPPGYPSPYGAQAMPHQGQAGGYQAPAPAGYGSSAAPAPAVPAAESADTTAEPVENAAVSIQQMRFDPPRVVVKKGGTVTWKQRDSMPHMVTANDGSFSSSRLDGGTTFSQTFEEAGTYAYYCGLHPSMRGEVVVID
jgi:amicyanin